MGLVRRGRERETQPVRVLESFKVTLILYPMILAIFPPFLDDFVKLESK